MIGIIIRKINLWLPLLSPEALFICQGKPAHIEFSPMKVNIKYYLIKTEERKLKKKVGFFLVIKTPREFCK